TLQQGHAVSVALQAVIRSRWVRHFAFHREKVRERAPLRHPGKVIRKTEHRSIRRRENRTALINQKVISARRSWRKVDSEAERGRVDYAVSLWSGSRRLSWSRLALEIVRREVLEGEIVIAPQGCRVAHG